MALLTETTVFSWWPEEPSGRKRKKAERAAPLYSVEGAAKPLELPDYHLTMDEREKKFNLHLSRDNSIKDSLTFEEIIFITDKIAEFFYEKYGECKEDRRWQDLYQVHEYEFRFFKTDADLAGDAADKVRLLATGCRGCGLILPITVMQVDHQRPKSTPYSPMLKAMKFFRLLNESHKVTGHKNKQLQRLLPNYKREASHQIADCLWNGKGVIFLAVIENAGVRQTLMNLCVHSLLNLAPMCGRCNASAGNRSGQSLRKKDGFNADAVKRWHTP